MKKVVTCIIVLLLCITSLSAYSDILDGIRFRAAMPFLSFDYTIIDFYESHNDGDGKSVYSSKVSPHLGLDVSYSPQASLFAFGGNIGITCELWPKSAFMSKSESYILRGDLAGTVSLLTPVMNLTNSICFYGDLTLSAGASLKTNLSAVNVLPLLGASLSLNIGNGPVLMCIGGKGTCIVDLFSPKYQRSISWNLLTQIGLEWRI